MIKAISAMALAFALAAPALAGETAAGTSGAPAVHQRVLVLDSHADILLPSTPARYYLPDGGSRIDLPHLTAGGVDAIVLAIAVGSGPRDAAGVAEARSTADAKLGIIRKFIDDNPQRVALALTADDVVRLHREGKVAVVIAFQNARIIGSDLSQIDAFYRDGVRVFAFNHAGHNDLADSSRPWNQPAIEHGGLSALGRQAVKKLNDLGVLIDVSQSSTDAVLQTVRLSRVPVVATHSAARALVDNARNLSDAELDAIKAKGGVIQVTPFTSYVHNEAPAESAAIRDLRGRFGLTPKDKSIYEGLEDLPKARQDAFYAELYAIRTRGTLAEFVDHIDYIARRIGWQHVGIGTDFDHGGGVVGFDSEADAPNVTAELLRRGYTEQQVAAIWGGNFLRVLHAAQAGRRK